VCLYRNITCLGVLMNNQYVVKLYWDVGRRIYQWPQVANKFGKHGPVDLRELSREYHSKGLTSIHHSLCLSVSLSLSHTHTHTRARAH